MKRFFALSSLLIFAIIVSSFTIRDKTENPSLPLQTIDFSKKKIIVVQFSFTVNNCTSIISVTINTNTNAGWGTWTMTCAGQNSQTITFTVKNVIVIAPFKGHLIVVPEDLDDFTDSATDTQFVPSIEQLETIAKGITDNGAFDD